MDGHHVGLFEQVFLGNAGRAAFGGPFVGQVFRPGDNLHAQRVAEGGRLRAQLAQADDAERLAAQPHRETFLPSAGLHAAVFLGNFLGHGEDQGPGLFERRIGQDRRAANGDAHGPRLFHVPGQVTHARGHHHLQVRQFFQLRRWKAGALAHADHDVIPSQRLGDPVFVGLQEFVEGRDLHVRAQTVPVGKLQSHVLVVVQDGDAGHDFVSLGFLDTGPAGFVKARIWPNRGRGGKSLKSLGSASGSHKLWHLWYV